MRLFISLGDSSINELKFDRGPVYVGRQEGCQVLLPDKAVSRQHAVFYTTKDSDWIIEDLGSSNKTYLNTQAIHKAGLKHNDTVRIADFSLRVSLEDDEDQDRRLSMEDTLTGETLIRRDLHTVDRRVDAADAPPFRFAAKQILKFHEAVTELGGQKSLNSLYTTLNTTLFRQFSAKNIWLALRLQPSGPMDLQGGRKVNAETIARPDLAVPKSLAEAIEKNQYLLIHQLPRQIAARGIRSVMICPIMLGKNSYGMIYIENSTEHSHYSLPDLDYLILISIFVAYEIEKIKDKDTKSP